MSSTTHLKNLFIIPSMLMFDSSSGPQGISKRIIKKVIIAKFCVTFAKIGHTYCQKFEKKEMNECVYKTLASIYISCKNKHMDNPKQLTSNTRLAKINTRVTM